MFWGRTAGSNEAGFSKHTSIATCSMPARSRIPWSMNGNVAMATFSAGTPIRMPIVRGLLWRDLRIVRVGLPRYPIFAARFWTFARVSALMAGWLARLRETVVRDSFSRSAIACWLIVELMGEEDWRISECAPCRKGGRANAGVSGLAPFE